MNKLFPIVLALLFFGCDYAPTEHTHSEYAQFEGICATRYTGGGYYYNYHCNIIDLHDTCDAWQGTEWIYGFNETDPIQTCEDACNQNFSPGENYTEIYLQGQYISHPFDIQEVCAEVYGSP